MAKKLHVFLANLGIVVPVHELRKEDSQVVVLNSDIPENVRRRAGLTGKTTICWYGPNAGGNELREGENDAEQKAKETVETVARAVTALAESTRAFLGGKLNKRAILVLLASASGESQATIEKILDAAAELDKTFTKK